MDSISTRILFTLLSKWWLTEPDISLEEMIVKVTEKMKEIHIPRLLANFFTKDMSNLKRWKK